MKFLQGLLALAAVIAQAAPRTDAVNLGEQPVWFEENRGQVDARARYFARGHGYHVYLNNSEAILALHGEKPAVLTMKLDGARREAAIEGGGTNADRSSYFHGNDPKKWVTGVEHHSSVRVRGAWEGVDVRYYENGRRLLEHDFVVAAGADASRIRMRFEGAAAVRVEKDGALAIETAAGPVRWEKPEAYQTVDGARRDVESAYRVRKDGAVDFVLGEYDRGAELVIDPELVYARFVGGSGDDQINDIVYRPGADELVIVGETTSVDLPVVNAFDDVGPPYSYYREAFLLRTALTGTKHFTYIGGSNAEAATSVAVDGAGNAYVGGWTSSYDFPAQGGFQSGDSTATRGFVLKLSSSGQALIYSSTIGGGSETQVTSVALDGTGAVYSTGFTSASNFPVTVGAFQTIRPANTSYPGSDAFVAKLNPAGTALVYASYLGGSGEDRGNAIAVNVSGEAFVAGTTASAFLATQGALRTAVSGQDAFVARISATGNAKLYFTYFGGSGDEEGKALALDANVAIVGGSTTSMDLAVVNATQATSGGSKDGFIAILDANGTATTFATYLGGYPDDTVNDIAAVSASSFVAVGGTSSGNFPTVSRIQRPGLVGEPDGFVTWFRATPGYGIAFSTNLGGPGTAEEAITSVSIDPADIGNRIYVGGWTKNPGFPADGRPAVAKEYGAGQSCCSTDTTDGFYARLTTAAGACTPEMWIEPSVNGTDAVIGNGSYNEASKLYVKVRAAGSCAWSVTAPPAWMTVSRTSGTGVDALVLQSQPNNTGVLRSASLTISPGGGSVAIVQGANSCYQQLSPNPVTLSEMGAATALTLAADPNCAWERRPIYLPPWLTVTQTSGQPNRGNATFTVSGTAFLTAGSRFIDLSFGSNNVRVVQNGCAVSLGTLPGFPAGGATQPLSITTGTGCTWAFTGLPTWLTVAPSSGAGPATVQVTAASNNQGYQRNHAIQLGNASVQAIQTSQNCDAVASPGNLAIGFRGGLISVPVNASIGCRWRITDVNGNGYAGSGTGAGTGQMSISANLTPSTLTTNWTIRDEQTSQVLAAFTVQQSGLPAASPVVLSASSDYNGYYVSFADANGESDLNVVNVLIADALDGRHACYLAFVRDTSTLFLVNDAGDGLVQPGLPVDQYSGTGFTANSQCVVNGSATSLSTSGARLDLRLGLTGSQAFRGPKVVYLAARDKANNNSGWVPGGIWQGVPQDVTSAPRAISAQPAAGTGRAQVFEVTAYDTNGAIDIQSVSFLLSGAIDGRQACYFGYHRPSNSLQLINDNGSGIKGSIVLDGGAGVIENNQCRIRSAGSSSTVSGDELRLTLNVEFKAAFAGDRVLYLGIQDLISTSGWTPLVTYTVIP
ncbi:MAG: SBBP repeat-containing protein [Bryobacteraceae bacterium]